VTNITENNSSRNGRDKIIAKAKFDLANRIRADIELTPSTRLVGLYIADHINTKRGYAWCTQEQIAAGLGIDERTVRRAIKDLDRYFAVNRSCRAHEYRIVTPDNLSTIAPNDTGHFCSDTGQKCTSIPDKNVTPSLENLLTSSKGKEDFVSGIREEGGGLFTALPGSPEFEAWRTYLQTCTRRWRGVWCASWKSVGWKTVHTNSIHNGRLVTNYRGPHEQEESA
jgi:hypothetical protein